MKKVIIVGGGTSIKEGIELGLWNEIKNSEIWALNSAFLAMPYTPSKIAWVDVGFFNHNCAKLQQLRQKDNIELICKDHMKYASFKEQLTAYKVCRQKDMYSSKGICSESHELYFVGAHCLSGVFALSVAINREYDEIYLLGYDWGNNSLSNPLTHFYQERMEELNIKSSGAGHPGIYLHKNDKPKKKELSDFDVFDKEKAKIYNVSPSSHIPNFEKIDYPTFFNKLKEI